MSIWRLLLSLIVTLLTSWAAFGAAVPWGDRPAAASWFQADPNGYGPPLSPEPKWAGTKLIDVFHASNGPGAVHTFSTTWEARVQTTKPYQVFRDPDDTIEVWGYFSPDPSMGENYPELVGAYVLFCTDLDQAYPVAPTNPAWNFYELTWTAPTDLHRNCYAWGTVDLPDFDGLPADEVTWLSARMWFEYEVASDEMVVYEAQWQMWGVPEPCTAAMVLVPLAIVLARRCKE